MKFKALVALAAVVAVALSGMALTAENSDAALTDEDNDGTITLTAETTDTLIVSNRTTITLNLNGQTLIGAGNGTAVTVQSGATLVITGTGTINTTSTDGAIKAIANNGGTVVIAEGADVTLGDELLVDDNGTLNIYGKLNTGTHNVANREGTTVNIYGTFSGGTHNLGTFVLHDGCDVLTARIGNTVTLAEDCAGTLNVYVSHQDEQEIGNAIGWAIYNGNATYRAADRVVITIEGSNDPRNPLVYTVNDDAPSWNSNVNAKNLAIRAEEGTYATVILEDSNLTLSSHNWAVNDPASLTIENLRFVVTDDVSSALLHLTSFEDTTLKDCSFTDVHISCNAETTAAGTFTAIGCVFKAVDTTYTSYTVVTVLAKTVFTDNHIIDYQRGLSINFREGTEKGANVTGNVFSGIDDYSGGFAIQIANNIEGATVDITGNTVEDCLYALRVHDSCEGTPTSTTMTDNRITGTPYAVLYSPNEKGNIADQVVIEADRNYFAPTGTTGVPMTVVNEDGETISGLVNEETYYVSPDMDTTNKDVSPPWIYDDSDEWVPPVMVTPEENSSNDTVKVVACAAAAVVAALMAAFLIIDRKGN